MRTNSYIVRSCGFTGWWDRLLLGACFRSSQPVVRNYGPECVVVSAIVLTLVPVCYGSGLQRGKGSVGNVRSNIHVDRGLIDCARYIRNQPPADAVVQDSQLDKLLIVGGLTDRPSFAARVDEWTRQSKAFRESGYQEQLGKLQRLQQADKHSGFAAQRPRNGDPLVRGSSRRSQRLASRVSRSTGIRVQRLSSLRYAALFRSAWLIFAGHVAVARRFY